MSDPTDEPVDSDPVSSNANVYSPEAQVLFSQAILEFTEDLDSVSERLRRRRRTDVISAVDVDRALEALGVRTRSTSKRALSIGGSLVSGGALGYLIQVLAEGVEGKPIAGVLGVGALFTAAVFAVVYGEKD